MDPPAQRLLAELCLLSAQIETGSRGQVVERSYTERSFRVSEASITVRKKSDGSTSDIYCRYFDGEIRSLMVNAKRIELKGKQ